MLNNIKLFIINKSLKKLNKLLNIDLKNVRNSLQTHHVDSMLKRRGNGRFHVVSTWNPRGAFVGVLHKSSWEKLLATDITFIYRLHCVPSNFF